MVDSGTFRLPTPRAERQQEQTRSSAEIVFFPVVAGVPVQPAVDEETRITAPATPGWRIILPRGGQVVPLAGALYIGRNPVRTADRPDAELVAVDDPAKSLSKTHALLEVDDDVLYVHDLDSTNGVYIVQPDASVVDVEPGRRAAVAAGAELELGEYVVRVERA
ncbi:FHA domain-containing protein [Lacisediminihabitans sp. G11-30]|uniref:FHA domain-containing protein n=1 Tax=Lacisediminihabitans changchengi TaxID=2787634 RepID=A0A934SGL2_9MICO|nr:FHA domain-containing protein [Lacisediminihabitans changchengi]